MRVEADYVVDGYTTLDLGMDEQTLVDARAATGPRQPDGYHYNPAATRTFLGWRGESPAATAIRRIAYSPAILSLLRVLYRAEPRPLQTISFDRGSNQPLHQDGIHFQTWPKLGRMVGVWVALEDVDEENGTLCYVPRSHDMGYVGWQELGLKMCDAPDPKDPHDQPQFPAYYEYERRLLVMADANGYGPPEPFVAPMGHAFVWGLELLHGGWPVVDESRTRHSLVIHYIFDDAEAGWAPMFSDPGKGEYLWKSTRYFTREGVRVGLHE